MTTWWFSSQLAADIRPVGTGYGKYIVGSAASELFLYSVQAPLLTRYQRYRKNLKRLVGQSRHVPDRTATLMAILTADGIVYMLVPAFECLPVASLWDKTIAGTCLNLPAVIYSGASSAIILDLVIIALPIPELRTLNLDLMKKIVVGLMFSVGSL